VSALCVEREFGHGIPRDTKVKEARYDTSPIVSNESLCNVISENRTRNEVALVY
jgi:hypothetical protein